MDIISGRFGWSQILGVWVTPIQRMAFVSGINKGMSASSIIDSLKGTEHAIRRQVGLALAREIRDSTERQRSVSATPLETPYSDSAITQVSTITRDKYGYWGYVDAYNPTTKTTERYHVNFAASDRLTPMETYQRMYSIMQNAMRTYGLEYKGIGVTSITQSTFYD